MKNVLFIAAFLLAGGGDGRVSIRDYVRGVFG
jgi:hypothetical protein